MESINMSNLSLPTMDAKELKEDMENQQGPVLDYHFSCDSNGNSKVNSSSSLLPFGHLVGLESTNCTVAGISSASILESNSTIANLRQHFMDMNATGFVVEAWITPLIDNGDLSIRTPFITIGEAKDECHEFYMGHRGDLLEICHQKSDFSCRCLLLRQHPLIDQQLVQIVVNLNQG